MSDEFYRCSDCGINNPSTSSSYQLKENLPGIEKYYIKQHLNLYSRLNNIYSLEQVEKIENMLGRELDFREIERCVCGAIDSSILIGCTEERFNGRSDWTL